MKTFSMNEAKSKLDELAELCKNEEVVVTVDGKPKFEIISCEDENLFADLLETNAKFRKMMTARVKKMDKEPKYTSAQAKRLFQNRSAGVLAGWTAAVSAAGFETASKRKLGL